jgi:hypothetical protein
VNSHKEWQYDACVGEKFKFITTTDDMIEVVLFCEKALFLEAKVPTNGNF